jgi:hypothetical protein
LIVGELVVDGAGTSRKKEGKSQTEASRKYSPPPRWKMGKTYNKPMFAGFSALFGYNSRYNTGTT